MVIIIVGFFAFSSYMAYKIINVKRSMINDYNQAITVSGRFLVKFESEITLMKNSLSNLKSRAETSVF